MADNSPGASLLTHCAPDGRAENQNMSQVRGAEAQRLGREEGGAYSIRPAGEGDQPALKALLARFVCSQRPDARYDWLYRKNPQGSAHTWVATPRGGDEIVGFTSIFARDVAVAGEMIPGGVGFDAYVLPDHRGRGLATDLHAASRQAMARREVPFHFMFGPPVAKNLRALVRAGSRVVGSLRYLNLPLSARGVLGMLRLDESTAVGVIERLRLLDAALDATRRFLGGVRGDVRVQPVFRPTEAFDEVFEDIAGRIPVVGRRDAAYLNWRYRQNPVCEQELVSIERKGRLLGWAALESSPRGTLLVDYLLPLDPQEGRIALGALIAYVAAQGSPRLTLRFNLEGPYRWHFIGQGFIPGRTREDFQCLVGELFHPLLFEGEGWHLTNGDLNPEASPWSVNTTPADAVPA